MQTPEQCQLCDQPRFRFVQSVRSLDVNCISDAADLTETMSHYFVCESCGTVMQWPQPTFEEMARYFKTSTIPDREILRQTKRDLFADRLRFLTERTGLTQGRVVEVGCREGNFLALLRDEYGFDVFGIDPSLDGVAMGRDVNGLSMLNATVESLDLAKEGLAEAFDLVLVMHAMEYVHRPRTFIEQLIRMVKPGGFLYLEVPALGYPYEELISGRYIHRQQLSHFLGAGLTGVLKDLGVTVVEQVTHRGFSYPSFQVLGQKMEYADHGQAQFLKELAHTNERFFQAGERLLQLLERYPQVALWGAGIDLHRVITLMPEHFQNNAFVLVDGNPAKQGKHLAGIPILAPSALQNPSAIVLTPSPQSICDDIRKSVEAVFPRVTCYALFAREPLPTPS